MSTPQGEPQSGNPVPPVQPPVTLNSKRWAQRADSLQFTELSSVRSVAQNWRTGLAGLTSLLSVTSIVVAPGVADRLNGVCRPIAGVLALAGLLALLYGTWQAMSAAFGVTGGAVRITGERLRKWESDSAGQGAAALARARRATLTGLVLLIATTAVVFFGATTNPVGTFVRAEGPSGSFCGHLGHSDAEKLEIIGNDGSIHQLDLKELKSIQPTSSC
ncbi:MAG: peptidase caspase catalytic subunit p20 [Nocardia sp.]|uniref:hypothetical protein n=1 Tax=Nocardia sp. TaxID=1821 RepID=UPI002618ED7E|nr:hypothetical protein [Nocardia sp.]MCU1640341.1 peptidase caspase catalytic subunit p20 [Nocardia sp.]